MKKMIQKIVAVVLTAGIIGAMFIGCGKDSKAGNEVVNPKVIDFNNYVRFEVEGTDGYGILEDVSIDYDQILADYEDKFEALEYEIVEESEYDIRVTFASKDGKTRFIVFGSDLNDAYINLITRRGPHMDGNKIGADYENGHMKNGDKIQIDWYEDEEDVKELEKLLGVKIKYTDFTYTIENLPEIVEVDPFTNVVFPMVGNCGEAYFYQAVAWAYIPTMQGNKETMIGLDITNENNKGYCNGDKVYAFLQEEVDVEQLAREYGIKFTRTEGEIEVCGLNAYGQHDADNGVYATVNLNDYVVSNGWHKYDGHGSTQIRIDYDAILWDFNKSISTNVAPEDMLYQSLPRVAVNAVFEYYTPFSLISTSHDYDSSGGSFTNLGENFSNGDIIKMSWEVNEEGLEMLSKLMNVDFVYEDFEITVEGLKTN